MTPREIVIASPVRTAIATLNGSLKEVAATELGAIAVAETLRRGGLPGHEVGAVIMGNVVQAGNQMNPARQTAIKGGLPVSVPAFTVNRVCGSGAQAILSAAVEIIAGEYDLAIAGGMENMDRAPYLLDRGRWGYRLGHAQILDSLLTDGLVDAFSGEHSGWHTEDLAEQLSISREQQDSFAARSHARFTDGQRRGLYTSEIVPVPIKGKKTAVDFRVDEAPRPETTVSVLSTLRPAFRTNGTITAGNAPGLNAGASSMIVSERCHADSLGLDVYARIAGYGVAAVEPGLFGLGPVQAVKRAVARAGWELQDVERFEINEAFAVVPLAIAQVLGVPLDIVNVDGGAVAHGHPIGATGAILTTRLLHAMRRDRLKRSVVALCIGGGQGIALALESI